MNYDTYNSNSILSPNQAINGRDSSLYVNEDVPVLPRRYHEKLREGDETVNKKHLYPPEKFPDLYKDKDEEEDTIEESGTTKTTAEAVFLDEDSNGLE